jgi:hypothetical protein
MLGSSSRCSRGPKRPGLDRHLEREKAIDGAVSLYQAFPLRTPHLPPVRGHRLPCSGQKLIRAGELASFLTESPCPFAQSCSEPDESTRK